MVARPLPSERLLVQQTAEEYRRAGYDVSTEAPLDFFEGFRADLVARKDDQARVIEVKSRAALAADPRIVELAQLIESMPGWSFELALVGEPERLAAPSGSRPFSPADVARRLDEATLLLGAGHIESAFLLGWSGFEAAARMLLAEAGAADERITTTTYLLDQARYLGILEQEAYDRLSEALRQRNAIVHGFSQSELDPESVRLQIQAVRDMLDSPGVPSASAD